MNTNHVESELKFLAPKEMTEHAFHAWVWSQRRAPIRDVTVTGTDTYYTQGTNVIRHRKSGNGQELTTKCRSSSKSLIHRLEVDLFLSKDSTQEDVVAFLLASGWK